MEDNRCFEQGCMLNVEYECLCSSPQVFTCKLHALNHIEVPNKDHALKQIFAEPCEKTREAILKFLEKCDAKHKKIKEKILAAFSQQYFDTKKDLKELVKEIDSYSGEINNLFKKISEAKSITKSEQNSVLMLLSLQPNEAVEKVKAIISPNPDWYKNSKVFTGLNEKIENMIECWIENKLQDYLDNRLTKIENTLNEHNKSIYLANNELANVKNSILNIINENNKSLRDFEEWNDKTKLKTENEINLLSSQISSIIEDFNQKFKEVEKTQRNFKNIEEDLEAEKSEILENSKNTELEKELKDPCLAFESDSSKPKTSAIQEIASSYQSKKSIFNLANIEHQTTLFIYNTEIESQASIILNTPHLLDQCTCITQLPNGKLFCFGNYPPRGITILIDENYKVEELQSGAPCYWSSAIYFNNNVYCFGGYNGGCLPFSSKFDLDRNQWNELTPMLKPDYFCNSIIFNRNILISGYENKNILRYSIDSNSFLTIPYEFGEKKWKMLINAERLYLIESYNGAIYESEIGSDIVWRKFAYNSTIRFTPNQTYYQYNKEEIYIGCIDWLNDIYHFKFNLNEKRLIKLV